MTTEFSSGDLLDRILAMQEETLHRFVDSFPTLAEPPQQSTAASPSTRGIARTHATLVDDDVEVVNLGEEPAVKGSAFSSLFDRGGSFGGHAVHFDNLLAGTDEVIAVSGALVQQQPLKVAPLAAPQLDDGQDVAESSASSVVSDLPECASDRLPSVHRIGAAAPHDERLREVITECTDGVETFSIDPCFDYDNIKLTRRSMWPEPN